MSSDSVDRNLLRGGRIRAARENKGISQRELARQLGLGINQINRYELGLNDPSSTMLSRLAEALDVSTDYLVGLSDVPQNYAAETLRPDERRLLDAFNTGDTTTVVTMLTDRVRQLAAEQEKK